jgi:hypothetical protein
MNRQNNRQTLQTGLRVVRGFKLLGRCHWGWRRPLFKGEHGRCQPKGVADEKSEISKIHPMRKPTTRQEWSSAIQNGASGVNPAQLAESGGHHGA